MFRFVGICLLVKVSGAVSGGIAGLVAITPGAGFIEPVGAAITGGIVALIVYVATTVMKYRMGYDDTLDAFGLHGVGGVAGGLFTGIFATKALSGQKRFVIWWLAFVRHSGSSDCADNHLIGCHDVGDCESGCRSDAIA